MEYYAIDRIEGNYAVCEKDGETMVNISRALLPDGASEGNVLRRLPDGTMTEGCAERYEISDDGLRYTFTLRENLRSNSWTVCLMNNFPIDFSGVFVRYEKRSMAHRSFFVAARCIDVPILSV